MSALRSEALRRSTSKRVEVVDSIATFSVFAPNEVRLDPLDLVGYWFPRTSGRSSGDVPFLADGAVFEIEVNAAPAGVIYGSVREADGSSVRGARISVSVADVKDNPMKGRALNVEVKNSSSSHELSDRYLATPLPLGGIYVISVTRNYTHVLSDLIEITKERPLHTFDCVLPVGQTVAGRILDSQGKPIAHQKTRFSYRPDVGDGFSKDGPLTDAEGRFQIAGINFDVDGTYYLEVKGVSGHQPNRLELKPRKHEQVLKLEQGLRISGVVREVGSGRLIPGVELYAMRAPYQEGVYPISYDCERSDARGRFEFTNLPEGTFNIRSRAGITGSIMNTSGFNVTAGASGEIELEMELYEWSGLVPVDVE